MATKSGNTEPGSGSAPSSDEVLNIQDVLSGIAPDAADATTLVACILFETVGNDTVVSVDIDGAGPAAPVPIMTLANVTGLTLQALLNDTPLDA